MLRLPKFQTVSSAWERLCDTFFRADRRHRELKPRRLIIDQLEERQLLSVSAYGTETQIDNTTDAATTTAGDEAVAVDNAGDYVTVWTAADVEGTGIWMQVNNADGTVRKAATLVNTTTEGDQKECSVAMDDDGDFVVTWSSVSDYTNTSEIYAQRFNSAGTAIGSEILVNTNTANNQTGPSVACDGAGDFIIVWSSMGQNVTGEVKGQIFSSDGERVGGEFQVNGIDVSATTEYDSTDLSTKIDIAPTVAMSDVNTFVVAWNYVVTKRNSIASNSVVKARLFSWDATSGATAVTSEFRADVGGTDVIADSEAEESFVATWYSRDASVAMNSSGTFIIGWQSQRDVDTLAADSADQELSWGIYYRVFDADGTAQTTIDCQANQVVTYSEDDGDSAAVKGASAAFGGDQTGVSVAMDDNGDFTIAWSGNGADSQSPQSPVYSYMDQDTSGVWVRRFAATSSGYSTTPAVSAASHANLTTASDQQYVSIAETSSGDYVVVWTSNQIAGTNHVFAQAYNESIDTVGPIATDFLTSSGDSISDVGTITTAIQAIILTFDEPLSSTAATNVNNYVIMYNGTAMTGIIASAVYAGRDTAYGLSSAIKATYGITVDAPTYKFQVVLLLTTPLADGTYQVVVKNSVRDAAGNPLQSTGNVLDGNVSSETFYVNKPAGESTVYTTTSASTTASATASDGKGDYVIVWADSTGVWAQICTQTTTIATDLTRTATVSVKKTMYLGFAGASDVAVAMDDDGDFVVTWALDGDIYAEVFNANGVDKLGTGEFRVNADVTGTQALPSVAMDTTGNFVITWQSAASASDDYDIHAKYYYSDGTPLNGANATQTLTIAEGVTGSFALVWDDDGVELTTDSISYGSTIYETAENVKTALQNVGAEVTVEVLSSTKLMITFIGADGCKAQAPLVSSSLSVTVETATGGSSGEVVVNSTTDGNQLYADVAMSDTGYFVVTWTSYALNSYYGDIYARQFAVSSGVLNTTDEFKVNSDDTDDNDSNEQSHSSVAMDADSDFVITWTSYGQDGSSGQHGSSYSGHNGVFAKIYLTDGSASYVFMVNETTTGNQQNASVAMDADGDFVITWESNTSMDGTSYDVYARRYSSSAATSSEFMVNSTTTGSQRYASVSMDDTGDIVIAWTSTGGTVGVLDQRFVQAADTAGPTVTAVATSTSGSLVEIQDGDTISSSNATQIIITLSEEVSASTITNLSNWTLYKYVNGYYTAVTGAIASVKYGLNEASVLGLGTAMGKYEVVITLDGNTSVSGNQSLASGDYYLVLSDSVKDRSGNQLDGDYDGATGTSFQFSFTNVDSSTGTATAVDSTSGAATSATTNNAVASDADGDYVVTWTDASGVWFQTYKQTTTNSSSTRTTSVATGVKRLISGTAGASDAAVAIDADGDFVVTWSFDGDVYAELFDANGIDKLGSGVFQVNSVSAGTQIYPSVAMDTAGNFVITWQTRASSTDDYDIVAKYYKANGEVFDGTNESQTITFDASFAGSFYLSWDEDNDVSTDNSLTTAAIAYGSDIYETAANVQDALNAIHGGEDRFTVDVVDSATLTVTFIGEEGNKAQALLQAVDSAGNDLAGITTESVTAGDSGEFVVNDTTSGDQEYADVAMSDGGVFVITWTNYSQGEGSSYGDVYANFYMPTTDAFAYSGEVLVNSSYTTNDQSHSSVAVDAAGNIVIAWTSYGEDGSGNGVYAKHYTLDAANFNLTVGTAFQVNETTLGNQQSPCVAMDGDGDFIITWEGSNAASPYDIYARRYSSSAVAAFGEFVVNSATGDSRRHAGVSMDDAGDVVVVWDAVGTGTTEGVWSQRYASSTDVAGPLVTDVAAVTDGVLVAIEDNTVVSTTATQIVLTLSENVSSSTITNLSNWSLYKDVSGTYTLMSGAVVKVQYGLNESYVLGLTTTMSGKYEVVVTLDGNSTLSGNQILSTANYLLVLSDSVKDLFGNKLDGNDDGTAGTSYTFAFTGIDRSTGSEQQVSDSSSTTSSTTSNATASDAKGDYVEVWTDSNGVWFRVYTQTSTVNADSTRSTSVVAGAITAVSSDATACDASVAMDDDGDFIVTWSAYNSVTGWDIYAAIYGLNGIQTTATFRVNSVTAGTQSCSSVAMDTFGDFAITWQSRTTAAGDYDIIAKYYTSDGKVFGGTNETQTIAFSSDATDVAFQLQWDEDNNTATASLVTATITYGGNAYNIVQDVEDALNALVSGGGCFSVEAISATKLAVTFIGAQGSKDQALLLAVDPTTKMSLADVTVKTATSGASGEFTVNTTTSGDQVCPDVAISDTGLFIVTWTSYGQYESVEYGDIFANYFQVTETTSGSQLSSSGAFLVTTNDGTTDDESNDQNHSSVAMDADGDFVIAWMSYGHDGSGSGIYAKQYGTTAGTSFLVNETTVGNQRKPSVAMDADGDFTISWEGSSAGGVYDVYARRYLASGTASTGEFVVNSTTAGNQHSASVSLDDAGDLVVVWSGAGNGASQGVFYQRYAVTTDTAGPTVTDVVAVEDGNLVQVRNDGNVASDSLTRMIVTLGENVSASTISNLSNWTLVKNESGTYTTLTGVIVSVQYGLSEAYVLGLTTTASGKYEAVVTFDSDLVTSGKQALEDGEYELVLSDSVTDLFGNKLDGNYDGTAGTSYSLVFTVEGGDSGVNTTTYGTETTADSDRCVAMNNAGGFVVVWVSYADDNADVYMRLYDSDGNAITDETLVNTCTAGDQLNCSVAMDGDGDFVIVWASEGQDSADSSWGIYAQRFNATGAKVGSEIHVNTNVVNNQTSPSVAVDTFGDFVVVWTTSGQSYSYYNDIKGQVFSREGNRVGGEFRVNSVNIPDTVNGSYGYGNQVTPSVAMSDIGTFVVTWTAVVAQTNGYATNTLVMARLFSWSNAGASAVSINGSSSEFQVSVGVAGFIADYQAIFADQLNAIASLSYNAQVAMNASGTFVITWVATQDNDLITDDDKPDSAGIYYRVFNANGTAQTSVDCQANQVVTTYDENQPYSQAESDAYAGDQTNPSVSIDADGDFTITWDGNGSNGGISYYGTDSQGVWVRSFHATQTGYTSTPAVTYQTRVNSSVAGSQAYSSVAMNASGDYVVVWSGYTTTDSTGVYFSIHNESTDTAGPTVTDMQLPDGTSITSSVQVTEALTGIVLTFDEAMQDNSTSTGNAVTNASNYKLLKDGVYLSSGISKVYYFLNSSSRTSDSQWQALVAAHSEFASMAVTDKYTAVLILDSNGVSTGVMPLTNGQYEVVISNSLRDVAGNALNSTGPGPNGSLTSAIIYVTVPSGTETKVASGTTADDSTYGKYTYATTADAVASDSDGDYVVAWTDTTTGHKGVWVKMYEQTTASDGTTSVSVCSPINPATGAAWANNEICVSSDTTATDISVARNDSGDFVVTWSAWDATTGWDVYAQRYDATGQAVGSTFRVNSTTADTQRNSSVSMDAEGDFVITWQSEDQDGSGYGIYAQAYNANGKIVGGTNEVQAIDFTNGFTGSFVIRWDDDNDSTTADKVTASVTFNGNSSSILTTLEEALAAIGANVKVVSNGVSGVLIEFIDGSGNADVQSLWIASSDIQNTSGISNATVSCRTVTAGEAGEFQVNETTDGDQVTPDVSMDSTGDFVITWTSYGQDGDDATDSNVYAKRYSSTSIVWNSADVDSSDVDSDVDLQVTTIDDPNDYVVTSTSSDYESVVQIMVMDYDGSTYSGSGSLLVNGSEETGYWILTAAHVVWSEVLSTKLAASQVMVCFDTADGRVTYVAEQVIVNPGWTGLDALTDDIALIKLKEVPDGVEGLQINTDTDEVGQTLQLIGYGSYGTGTTGNVYTTDDQKRTIFNIYDTTATILGYTENQLAFDFDDGTSAHDGFGVNYGIYNTDSALVASGEEGNSASGDSGGPELIDGKIAGIVSFGLTHAASDSDGVDNNSTYGEYSVSTRISSYADWIDSISSCLTGDQFTTGGEFLVNKDDITAVVTNEDGESLGYYLARDNQSGKQCQPSVALDSDGDFVITWTSYGQDGAANGYGASGSEESSIYARRYDSNGNQASDVFQVNQTTTGAQQNSNVAIDADGDFIVTWESNQNGTYDIYARRYANTADTTYTTTASSLEPLHAFVRSGQNSLYTTDSFSTPGVYILEYDGATILGSAGTLDVSANNGALGAEFRVSTTVDGDQRYASVAMDATGDAVVVWSGNGDQTGQEDGQGIFYQRYAQTSDTAGAQIAKVYNVETSDDGSTSLALVTDSQTLDNSPTQFVIVFSEDICVKNGTSGANSILNLSNWTLTENGAVLSGVIAKVAYSYNSETNQYEAVITFDSDISTSDYDALESGYYELTISSAVKDLFGNKLDGDYSGTPGTDYVLDFTVSGTGGSETDDGNTTTIGDPTTDSSDIATSSGTTNSTDVTTDIAMNSAGDYVIVWTTDHYGDGGDIAFQRYDQYGEKVGSETIVNAHTTTIDTSGNVVYSDNGVQTNCAVAMDSYGDYVIVWSGSGNLTGTSSDSSLDSTGIYAQIYDKNGDAVGSAILINQTTAGTQSLPSVAMDANGDFVVTWTSESLDGSGLDVYARRFSVQGTALSDEFLVNTTTTNTQKNSSVAMDDNGDFVIVWQSSGQDGYDWGVFGQYYASSGTKSGSEFQVDTVTSDKQINASVAMDSDGDFVVVYSSFGQDSSGYGVYARRYTSAGVARDTAEFQVNETTLNWQVNPDVAMADDGSFVVTWSSFGQDNYDSSIANPTKDYGIYARMYTASGADATDATGDAYGEFRVNAVTAGDQALPAVAISDDGTIIATAWTSSVSATGATSSSTYVLSRVMSTVTTGGPKISKVVVVASSGTMTWNAVDSDGVATAKLVIDGTTTGKVYGPYTASSGVNFSASFGTLSAGKHTYVITAYDELGHVSTYTGSFTVAANAGPTISDVVVSTTKGTMSWNALDSDGVASATVTVDGSSVSKVYGPYTATSGVNYSASFGTLSAGSHAYVITAKDKAGNTSTYSGTIVVAANAGPTISSVVVSPAKGTMSWNALDSDGVASASVTVDGSSVSKVYGPYTATSGVNYSASFGTLSAGSHTYVITAKDTLGNTSTSTGTFTVASAATNAGPTISSVVVSPARGIVSWNALDSNGVASASVTVDGSSVSKVYGPYTATSGVNYSASFGTLSAGSHSYVITAKDTLGNTSTYSGTFTVGSSSVAAAAHSAALQSAAVASSAKAAWLWDETAVSDDSDDNTTNAVDAVMASYSA
ncbi:MAG: hypothetical protein ABFC63_10400 [Thermoguttaceae bacterium]